MTIPKGYRAREAAALQRKYRGRVDLEVRAQRALVLEPKIHKAIVDTRDAHELKAIFEAAEKEAAEKKVSVTEQPVEQSQQVISDEQTEQVIDADEAEQTPVDQADGDATEKSTDEVKADKPAKSKSKNKNK